MLKAVQRYVSRQMMQSAESIEAPRMKLDRFSQYWAIDHQQLARLTRRSYSTVRKWFSTGGSSPDFEVEARLAAIHKEWMQKFRE